MCRPSGAASDLWQIACSLRGGSLVSNSSPPQIRLMLWQVKYMMLADRSVGELSLEAESAAVAEASLQREGRVALSCRPARAWSIARWPIKWPALSGRANSIALFCEELKALLDAGL